MGAKQAKIEAERQVQLEIVRKEKEAKEKAEEEIQEEAKETSPESKKEKREDNEVDEDDGENDRLDDEGEEIEISDTTQIFYFTTPEWSSVSLDNFSDMYLLGSPFTLLGNVPENWFVNDSFTVEVKNQSWSLISSTTAQEEISENSDFNFILNLEFEVPDPSVSETGFIKFASSEAESKDFLELPIMFQ